MYALCVPIFYLCFNRCAERVMGNIEIIYDELKQNKIHIDKHALSFHINRILNQNKDIYSQIHILDIEQLYREINITNFGRTIAYLACVYLQSEAMENPSQKCEICAQAGLNQTKLPRHYIRRKFKAETHLELSEEDMCAKCLFQIERDMFIYLACSIRPQRRLSFS